MTKERIHREPEPWDVGTQLQAAWEGEGRVGHGGGREGGGQRAVDTQLL